MADHWKEPSLGNTFDDWNRYVWQETSYKSRIFSELHQWSWLISCWNTKLSKFSLFSGSLISICTSDFFSLGYAVESELELGDHFIQNHFAWAQMCQKSGWGERWDDVLFLFQPCDCVIFMNRRKKEVPSLGIHSFENFPRASRLEVYLYSSSESWVVFKHVSGQPGLMPVYFTKRLVGLFDLAHVRSLIVFFIPPPSFFFCWRWLYLIE